MTKEDNDKINLIRSKTRFINSDLTMLKDIHSRLIGGWVDWKCPRCVRSAIDALILFQNKNKIETKKNENKTSKRKRLK